MSKIITTAELSAYMKKTVDASVGGTVVDAINDWVERETHRSWGELKTVTERYDWKKLLWLRHQDVVSIGSIKVGFPGQSQTTLAPGSYWFNSFGRVTMFWQAISPLHAAVPGSFIYNDFIEVTYSYGYAGAGYADPPTNTQPNVPSDLKIAALGIAAGFYNWATNGQKDIVSASVDTYKLEYAGRIRQPNPKGDPASNVNDRNWSIIQSYRMQRV